MTKIRSNPREVPPERQTMGDSCILGVLSMFGYSRGQHTNMVLSN
jgi:hypothetical protein